LSTTRPVFNITTAKDPALPKELATDADGKERFRNTCRSIVRETRSKIIPTRM